MTKRANQIADRILKAIPHDASPEDIVIAVERMMASQVTLTPSQRRDFARRIHLAAQRANELARERDISVTDWERFRVRGTDHYCRHHSTRH
jgi:hypothetical protein